MKFKATIVVVIALVASLNVSCANIVNAVHQPNVIIMHVNGLLWNDLGIHVNDKDSENSTPNIDYLAYSGVVLNRFYANGGLNSLFSGCYERSQYGNKNLMTFYFEQNGYNVNFIARNRYDKIESFERAVLDAIASDNEPFFSVVDFGHLDDNIKIPFVDEIVASVVTKAHSVGVLKNTIILFLSLPDNNDDSPLEINIRRTAFVYSPLLKLQQRVSNQIVHVIDLLPTLVNATDLRWRTRDRIYMDGSNQWQALNTNDEERLSVFGDNFYIDNFWKISYGSNSSIAGHYGSIDNENMESDRDMTAYDFDTYVKSIFASEIHLVLDKLSSEKIMYSRSRARVHCNLKDIDETAVKSIKCSRSKPCLFDLLQDPCEFDDKFEREYDLRRNHMKDVFERYLSGGSVDEVSKVSKAIDDPDESEVEDGTIVGIILGGSVVIFIVAFIIVVCVKEKCNQKRSVYHNKETASKSNVVDKVDKVGNGNGSLHGNSNGNGISTISSHL